MKPHGHNYKTTMGEVQNPSLLKYNPDDREKKECEHQVTIFQYRENSASQCATLAEP